MRYLGNILVIVILAFSLFFLALSTVVMTASTNWKEAHDQQVEQNRQLQDEIRVAQDELARREAALQQELDRRNAELAQLQDTNAELSNQIQMLQNETTDLRDQTETVRNISQNAAAQAEARAEEARQLREQFEAAVQQANDYAIQQTELNERIFELERALEVAQQNNEDLRNSLADYRNFLESRGLPSDPAQVRMAAGDTIVAPDIEGKVLRVDSRNDLLEVTIGSDDGVLVGQEYYVFRTGDNPQYIGKVRISATEADKSVAQVINRYLGRKVREGDDVAAKVRPRS